MTEEIKITEEKVLVLCATGKMGYGVVTGLKAAGFNEVYGTTRGSKQSLEKAGVKPIIANYIVKADVERAIKESGAKNLIFLTDFFKAAKSNGKKEVEQGKLIIDVAKAQGITYTIFLSVGDAEHFDAKTYHIHPKLEVEKYLKESGLKHSILRPVAFFENFDDAGNYNPLKKGAVKFLTEAPVFLVSTFDLGKAAAVFLRNQDEWSGKTLEASSYKGSVADVAKALEAVSGVPTKGSLAMPLCLRSLFLNDLHHMCLYIENGYPGTNQNIEAFRKVVPDALDAEGWFRHHASFANGEKIAKEASV
jgi:uncharacterized protein YbjT (DUF2867 family)